MSPNSTECIPNQLNFGTLKERKVIANFDGGRLTSDAGIVLIAELDKKLKISERRNINRISAQADTKESVQDWLDN